MGCNQSIDAGKRIKELLVIHDLDLPGVVYTSPHIRCGQTVTHALKGIVEDETTTTTSSSSAVTSISIELGLVESISEDWYRSWASPGADSTWGGP